jgi:hypothetical protein
MTEPLRKKLFTQEGIKPSCESCGKVFLKNEKVLSKKTVGNNSTVKRYCIPCVKKLLIWTG